MIRNLIWDVDGTLFDTYPAFARSFAAALDDFGNAAPLDWIESLARKTLGHCASALASEFQLDPEKVMLGFRRHYRAIPPEQQPPFPGVIRLCETIDAMGGLNVIVTHRGRESTDRFLQAHAMTRCFAGAITSDDGHPRKPDPAAYEAAIARHHLAREETLAIGDRDIDILAAQAAGLRACLFGLERGTATPDIAVTDYTNLRARILSENRA